MCFRWQSRDSPGFIGLPITIEHGAPVSLRLLLAGNAYNSHVPHSLKVQRFRALRVDNRDAKARIQFELQRLRIIDPRLHYQVPVPNPDRHRHIARGRICLRRRCRQNRAAGEHPSRQTRGCSLRSVSHATNRPYVSITNKALKCIALTEVLR